MYLVSKRAFVIGWIVTGVLTVTVTLSMVRALSYKDNSHASAVFVPRGRPGQVLSDQLNDFIDSQRIEVIQRLHQAQATHNKHDIQAATQALEALEKLKENAGISSNIEVPSQSTHDPNTPLPKATPPTPKESRTIPNAILLVGIMAVDLLVLWVLTKIKSNQSKTPTADATSFKANFSSKFKGIAGTITVAAAGSLGSFLTVLAISVAAILILDKFG